MQIIYKYVYLLPCFCMGCHSTPVSHVVELLGKKTDLVRFELLEPWAVQSGVNHWNDGW